MAITNKEILEEIEFLKKKLPNGEFALLKKSVEDLSIGQNALKSSIRELKQQLLDPDDGVVARINWNTSFRKSARIWLGVFFTSLIGIVTKMLFD